MKSELHQHLAEKMAGEITLSDSPGKALKKWRMAFEIPAAALADEMGMSPSVISDYESGRRRSPGTVVVGRIVDTILSIDEKNGGKFIEKFARILENRIDADIIFDIHEYASPVPLEAFARAIGATVIQGVTDREIYGYTVIHSLNAILGLSSSEFGRLYGWSTERALIFAGVSNGKSPMVAIRVTPFKPRCVVFQGITPEEIHPLVPRLAERDRITLMATPMDVKGIVKALRSEQW
ncbi:MAG TPA: helix-turn-helix domain-containing protein [Methanomicrobiales archaeon]|nr:helix-turn-helix domain-containing protein [Methanomicrobiales archaeon]